MGKISQPALTLKILGHQWFSSYTIALLFVVLGVGFIFVLRKVPAPEPAERPRRRIVRRGLVLIELSPEEQLQSIRNFDRATEARARRDAEREQGWVRSQIPERFR